MAILRKLTEVEREAKIASLKRERHYFLQRYELSKERWQLMAALSVAIEIFHCRFHAR